MASLTRNAVAVDRHTPDHAKVVAGQDLDVTRQAMLLAGGGGVDIHPPDAAPEHPGGKRAHNLQVPLTRLIGREQDIPKSRSAWPPDAS